MHTESTTYYSSHTQIVKEQGPTGLFKGIVPRMLLGMYTTVVFIFCLWLYGCMVVWLYGCLFVSFCVCMSVYKVCSVGLNSKCAP